MHRRDRRELFSPPGLRAYRDQDGNDLSDWISGRTVDRAVILCAAEECGGVLLHRTASRFANFSSAGRPGRICPQGHCVPAHRRPVRSMGRPPSSFGSSNLSSALTSRPGPMGSARAAWASTIQSGHARCSLAAQPELRATPLTNPAWPACRAEIRKPTRRTVQQHTPTFLCSTKYHGPIHSAPRDPVRKVIAILVCT